MISNIDKVLDAPTLLSGYGQSQARRAARGLPGQGLNAACQHHAVQGRVPIVRPSVVYTEDPEACNAARQRQRMTPDCWMTWRRGWDLNPRMEVLQTLRQNAMLLARLSLSCVRYHHLAWYSGPIVPKLFPSLWGEPVDRGPNVWVT